MMQHVQAENIRDARSSKGKLLRVGDGVEPGTPDEVGRDRVRRELLEKTWTRADFNGNTVWFSKSEQPPEKFLMVDTTQNGFLLPNAAMPEKLFLGLRIDSHCSFRLY